MFNDFEVIPDKTRVIELENGNKLRLTRTDPYGFIQLSLERGQMPDYLKDQSFTEWQYALKAAEKYISERTVVVEDIKKSAKA